MILFWNTALYRTNAPGSTAIYAYSTEKCCVSFHPQTGQETTTTQNENFHKRTPDGEASEPRENRRSAEKARENLVNMKEKLWYSWKRMVPRKLPRSRPLLPQAQKQFDRLHEIKPYCQENSTRLHPSPIAIMFSIYNPSSW